MAKKKVMVKVINRTNEDLVWRVEDAAEFGAAVLEIVPRRKISVAKTAQNVSGVFEYQVLMIKSGKKAKGKLSLTPEEVYPGVLRRAISSQSNSSSI